MVKNYIYNTLYQVLRIILPVITMPYVARVLSPNGVGAYSVSAAWASYFVTLGMIGIDTYGSRQIAYCRNDKNECRIVFWEINTLKSVTSLLSILIYSILIFGVIRPENILLYYIQLLNIGSCFFDVSWYFVGIENFKKTSIRNMIVKVISTICIFVLVNESNDVWLYSFIICCGQLIGQLVMWFDIRKNMFPIMVTDLQHIVYHLKKTVFLCIPSLAASVYNYLDKVMLGTFSGDFQVGLYEYSQNIVKVPAVLIFAIATVTMPRAAADFAQNKNKQMSMVFYKSMGIVSMLSIPMSVGFVAICDNLVNWFLGDQYGQVAMLIKISAWVIIPISLSQIVGSQIIIARGKEKYYSISICCGAVINVLFNLMLVKKYEAAGVLVASVIAEITVLLVMLYYSKVDINIKDSFNGVVKYFFVSLIMFVPVKMIQMIATLPSFCITLIQIIVGCTIYFALLLLIKDKNMMLVFRKIKEKLGNARSKG